jgi:hypothetical protein
VLELLEAAVEPALEVVFDALDPAGASDFSDFVEVSAGPSPFGDADFR